jgi:hypothetical protein
MKKPVKSSERSSTTGGEKPGRGRSYTTGGEKQHAESKQSKAARNKRLEKEKL